ncbi:hypothetical protein [Micromonospora matsumotoense]|uniref:hypothetical protein n=1 Tax=Micromonospora matsumotoense TaxID=121616 RepID=UPI003CCC0E09
MVWTPWLVRVRLTIAFAGTGDGVAAGNLDRVLERALLRWRIGGHAEPRQRYWSDRSGEFGEHGGHPQRGPDVSGAFVVPASEVLHEGMAGDDRLGGAVGTKSAHRSEPVLELAVISLDRTVRVPLDVVPRRRDQAVQHPDVDGAASVTTSHRRSPETCATDVTHTTPGEIAIRLTPLVKLVHPKGLEPLTF